MGEIYAIRQEGGETILSLDTHKMHNSRKGNKPLFENKRLSEIGMCCSLREAV